MRNDISTRFCIIGAGAAGLTAAETLKERGYTNITILEKAKFAGGKCRTIKHEGVPFELGAGIIAGSGQTILQLAEKMGVAIEKLPLGQFNLYDLETGDLCKEANSLTETVSFWWQLLLRYRRLCNQHQQIQAPGFSGMDPALSENFSDWAINNNLELLKKNLAYYFTGFGYGYYEDIPAAYVLKYYNWEALKSYLRNEIFIFPDGIQSLWNAIAKKHQVLYNTDIHQIHRDDHVTIETEDQKLEFDVLLLACPLDEALSFLDSREDEKALFAKIIYNDYQTYACTIDNFPQQTGFIPAHFSAQKNGHPVLWYKRYSLSNLYTLYVLSDWQKTENEITQNIKSCIQKMGGTLQEIHGIYRWKHFPHVTPADMQEGFYNKFEAMQGLGHTYYIGELPNFSTVELSALYAKNLVEENF